MEQNNPTNDSDWNPANNSGNGFNNGNDGFNNGGNMNRGNGFGDQFNQNFNKLPADPLALTLGIISLVLFLVGCWCYGVVGIITLIMSIIGLVQANRSLKIYEANPDQYSPSSYKNVNTAKILNIIAVILSAIACLVVVVIAIFFGAIFASAMNGEFNGFDDLDNSDNEEYYDDEYQYDDTEDGVYQYEEEVDSLYNTQDTLQIKETP